MPARRVSILLTAMLALSAPPRPAQAQGQTPAIARDTPAQSQTRPELKASLAGRVVAADTGRPVAGARVVARSPVGTGVGLTDDRGGFVLPDLRAGRYTLTVNRAGFVTLAYGQRRPFQPGTPIQLADGQQLTGIDVRLPRGSVIGGHVYDERGDPLAGVTVRLYRTQYVQGRRQLASAGTGLSDDRGQYRVWGLNPGEYYVSATMPPLLPGNVRVNQNEPTLAYAPTYYPGVASPTEGRAISAGLGEEVLGIDFTLLRVRTSTVSGSVMNADGRPAQTGRVSLMPEALVAMTGPQTGGRTTTIRPDGTFAISGVTPGRHTLRASNTLGRGRRSSATPPQYASQPLTVDGDTTTFVTLAAGATLSGAFVVRSRDPEASGPLTQFRVLTRSVDGSDLNTTETRVASNGTFTLSDVPAGRRLVRPQLANGWMLHAVRLNGRDITDTPLDIRGGARLTGIEIEVTNILSELSGAVLDQRGAPVTEYTVLAFPRDRSLWGPQSRHIMTARPDQTGRFELRGLPPEDYYVAIVDPSEPGEWFVPEFLEEHRAAAALVTLREGETKTQDFTVAVR